MKPGQTTVDGVPDVFVGAGYSFGVRTMGSKPEYKAKLSQPRRVTQVVGFSPSNNTKYSVIDNCSACLSQALMERYMFVRKKESTFGLPWGSLPHLTTPPKPKRNIWRENEYYIVALAKLVGRPTRYTLQEFVDSRPAVKRNIYRNAMVEYLRNGSKLMRTDSHPVAFCKLEKQENLNHEDPEKSVDICPRMILASDPKYNMVYGTWVSAIEEQTYQAIDTYFGSKVVQNGYNAVQVAANLENAWNDVDRGVDQDGEQVHMRLANCGDDNVAIFKIVMFDKDDKPYEQTIAQTLDASRADQHTHKHTVHFKQKYYAKVYKGHPQFDELKELMLWQRDYTINGFARRRNRAGRTYHLSVKGVKGKVRSGDIDTSLGHKIVFTALMHGFFIHGKYRPLPFQALKTALQQYCLDRGFKVKFEGGSATGAIATRLEHIEFCQTRPVFDGERYIMVRNLAALTKDCCLLCPPKDTEERLSQIGVGGRIMYPNIPIFNQFYLSMPDLRVSNHLWKSNDWQNSGMAYQSGLKDIWDHEKKKWGKMAQIERKISIVSEAARESFYHAFDVMPGNQVMLEADFSSLTQTTGSQDPTEWYGAQSTSTSWGSSQ